VSVSTSPAGRQPLSFPVYLWHSVKPHLGDYHRLAFSAILNLLWEGPARAESWALGIDQ
jgi:hypothetical protein